MRQTVPRGFQKFGFNTQPPEGGWGIVLTPHPRLSVSTHSHPKVAGPTKTANGWMICCFNTQPPEGGWITQWYMKPCV